MKSSIVIFFLLAISLVTGRLFAAETTRRGAKITKAQIGETSAPVLHLPDSWRLLDDEKWTGLNRREYYFTLEKEGKTDENPTVRIEWPGVKIAQIYGANDIQTLDDGARFTVVSSHAPTAFTSILPKEGAVSMGISHNVEGMQAGPYRGLSYPKNQIAAHLNYLFAAREMMREAMFTREDCDVDATINLNGFETNFPNGHSDFPPHFHIMTRWDGWRDIQATHFILAEDGTIEHNDHYVVEAGKEVAAKCVVHQPGEDIPLTDRSGKVRLILRICGDAHGVEMRVPGSEREYKITSENAAVSVTCLARENSSAEWKPLTVSRVTDDSIHGVMTVETEQNGSTRTEIWQYNPDTGDLLSDALWNGSEPIPKRAEIQTLENMEFVRVKERTPEKDGLEWQHGAAIALHKGVFYVSCGVNTGVENTVGEKILMTQSSGDWRHWEAPILLEPDDSEHGRSHGVFYEYQDQLWSLHARFVAKGKAPGSMFPGLEMESFLLNETNGSWENRGVTATGIWPLHSPITLPNQSAVVAGCDENWHGALAISPDGDPLHWESMKISAPGEHFTEGGLWNTENSLDLLLRNESRSTGTCFAAATRSSNGGRTWTTPTVSALAMNKSKPFCGTLPDGSRYLIGFTASDNQNRDALTIAVGRPNERTLSRVWKIRDVADPTPPGAFDAASFAYPYAITAGDRLLVVYSVGDTNGNGVNQNHIELAILPLNALK